MLLTVCIHLVICSFQIRVFKISLKQDCLSLSVEDRPQECITFFWPVWFLLSWPWPDELGTGLWPRYSEYVGLFLRQKLRFWDTFFPNVTTLRRVFAVANTPVVCLLSVTLQGIWTFASLIRHVIQLNFDVWLSICSGIFVK